jgi:hypothetical protein
MKYSEHVTRIGDRSGAYRVLVEKPEGKNNLEVPGVDGKIILKWIFRKWARGSWTGFICLRIKEGGILL